MIGIIEDLYRAKETLYTYEDYIKALNICVSYEVQNDIEIWRDIPNYKNHKASNFGKIQSCIRKHPVILKPTLKGSHLYVSISENNSRKNIRLDLLIANTYIINPSNKTSVVHKDKNNFNCSPLNLDWK